MAYFSDKSNEALSELLKVIDSKYDLFSLNEAFDDKAVCNDVSTLFELMSKYRIESPELQINVCQVLLKIARDYRSSFFITVFNQHFAILRILEENIYNRKLCCKTLHAIYIIAHEHHGRKDFNAGTCILIHKIMQIHSDRHSVIVHSLMAIANLVKCSKLRNACSEMHMLKTFIQSIGHHLFNTLKCKYGPRLIRNLAYSPPIAKKLVESGAIQLVTNMMLIHSNDIHLQKYCCQALYYMAVSTSYTLNVIESHAVKVLFAVLKISDADSILCRNAHKALIAAGIDWTGVHMASIHVAACRGLYESCLECLCHGVDVNVVDESGNTALHHSIEHQHEKLVQLFVSCGANIHLQNKNQESVLTLINKKATEQDQELLLKSIAKGKRSLEAAKLWVNNILFADCKREFGDFPSEICFLIIGFADYMAIMKFFV